MFKYIIILLILHINIEGAGILSAIGAASKKYDVPAEYLIKIAYLESSFGIQTNCRINKNGTTDCGAFQINSIHTSSTCKNYNLMTNLGNAMCAAKLVKMHMKWRGKDPCWLARYHSKTPSLKKKYCEKLKKIKVSLKYAE